MKSHEIDYTIQGDDLQMVTIALDPQETVVAEAGTMNWMHPDISFEAKTLNIDQNNEIFTAVGDPIKVKFFDGIEFIEGQANSIEIVSSSLILKDEVSIIKSGNKIKSDEIIIKLGKDDQD